MALKLRLKPYEKLIIGGAVLVNGPKVAEFLVENNVPILREADILGESQVTSPAKHIYFCVQLMYIDSVNLERYLDQFNGLTTDIITAAPSTAPLLSEVSERVMAADYYHALKLVRKLIEYEETLLELAVKKQQS